METMRRGAGAEDSGNQQNIAYIYEAFRRGKLSHAYIIEGETGAGKEAFADQIAAGLLCETSRPVPCGTCPSCIKAATGNHPDIIHVRHEKETVLSVGEIREQVVNDIAIKPYYGSYKIYIIPDAQLMNENAQNALLKTIEEPAAYGLLLLLTDNADGFLQTIRSRCIRIHLEGPSRQLRAQTLMDEEGQRFFEILDGVEAMDALAINKTAKELEAADRAKVLEILNLWIRDVLVYKSTENSDRLIFRERESKARETARTLSYEGIESMLRAAEDAAARLKASVKAEAAFENLLLSLRRIYTQRNLYDKSSWN